MSVKLEVWGDYACFSRSEMKTERVSYDMITPSAARGLLESIYWHPGMRWVIDKIYVLNPIRFTNIRRNEVKAVAVASSVRAVMQGEKRELYLNAKDEIQQRASMVLRDVHYVIEAHFEMTDKANASDNPGKFQDIIKRRLKRGECYSQPYFGTREFAAAFRLFEAEEILTAYPGETKDLGYMLYDFDYSDCDNIMPGFFRAVLRDGVLDLAECEVIR